MQTFLPSISFEQSAKWLDNARLGKQRVECLQILKALTDSDYGWQNHPAVKMWRGHEIALGFYGIDICNEWMNRGYKDSCLDKIIELTEQFTTIPFNNILTPPWLTEDFASNHRGILLGKAWEPHYKANDDLINATNEIEAIKANKRINKTHKDRDWETLLSARGELRYY